MIRRRVRSRTAPALLAAMEACEPRTLLTTYYVSPSGNDSAAGTSTSTAFKTVAKVNTLDLNPGDRVLFQGGQTFTPPAASTTNRVQNPGFESGNFNSWTTSLDETAGNTTITSTSGNVRGVYSARVGGTGIGGRAQTVSGLTPNSAYQVKLWAKIASGTGESFAGITFYDGATKISEKRTKIITTAFTQHAIAAVAPPAFTSAQVWFSKTNGTSVLFADDFTLNQTYGTVIFDQFDSGTPANPVTIGSYGTGRATINGGDGFGMWAGNVSGFAVQDLNFVGSWNATTGSGANVGSGLAVINDLPDNTKLDYIRINNVDASGFKWSGINVEGNNLKSGFRDVRITNSTAHDNGDVGIHVGGQFDKLSTLYAHSNVYVGACKGWNNSGIPNKGANSGTGIILGDVDGGMIERSVAWNNGALCNYTLGGPIGIWAWDSNAVTIQYNESYANKTGSVSKDGGGFDLDGGCTNCIMQYNYSHDNDGAGYLLYQFPGSRPTNNNIIRYNISQNDARAHHYAGIYLGGGTDVKNNDVYNNTIYITPTSNTTIAGIKITGVGSGNKFRNNIIQTTGGVKLVDTNTTYSTSSVLFQGNTYFSSGGTFGIKWSSTVYSDLASWRATGQEKNGTANTGLQTNPQLVAPGSGPTFGDASKLHTLTAYQLLSGSPMINAGLAIASPGGRDFYGSALPASGLDIGAFEATSTYSGAGSDETFRFRVGPSGTRELFVNAPTTGLPTIVWASGVYSGYTINANGGNDTFILDLASGNPLPSSGLTFAGGTHTSGDSISVLGTSGNDTVKVTNTAITPGGSGPSLNFSTTESINIDTGAGDDQLQYHAVTSAAVDFKAGTGNDLFAINSGTYTFNTDAASISSALAVSVASGAFAQFNAPQQLRSLTVAGGADAAPGGRNTIFTRSLTVSGTLDLHDNDLIVDYSGVSPLGIWNGTSYTGISQWIASARGSGGWSGSGVTSSKAAAGSLTTLGVAEASDILDFSAGSTASFKSAAVDATTVIVSYTYAGDADLDGAVNADDYSHIDYNARRANAYGYGRGDFNYDGKIDADDYAMIDYAMRQQGSAIGRPLEQAPQEPEPQEPAPQEPAPEEPVPQEPTSIQPPPAQHPPAPHAPVQQALAQQRYEQPYQRNDDNDADDVEQDPVADHLPDGHVARPVNDRVARR